MDIRGAPALMDIRSRIGSHHPPPSAATIALASTSFTVLPPSDQQHLIHGIAYVSAEIRGMITVPYCTGTNPSTHLPSFSFVCLSFPVVCLCTDGSYEMTKEAEQKCKRATGAAFSQGIQMIRLLSAAEWVRPDLGLLTCTGPQYIS